jgi:hypothetical protein
VKTRSKRGSNGKARKVARHRPKRVHGRRRRMGAFNRPQHRHHLRQHVPARLRSDDLAGLGTLPPVRRRFSGPARHRTEQGQHQARLLTMTAHHHLEPCGVRGSTLRIISWRSRRCFSLKRISTDSPHNSMAKAGCEPPSPTVRQDRICSVMSGATTLPCWNLAQHVAHRQRTLPGRLIQRPFA